MAPRTVRLVPLLLLLLLASVAARRGAAAPDRAAVGPDGRYAELGDTLDLLWSTVERTVRSAAEEVLAGLDSRLADVQTQLVRLTGTVGSRQADRQETNNANTSNTAPLDTQFMVLQERIAAQNAQIQAQSKQIEAQSTQLGALKTQIETPNTINAAANVVVMHQMRRIESYVKTVQSVLVSKMTTIHSQLEWKLDTLLSRSHAPIPTRARLEPAREAYLQMRAKFEALQSLIESKLNKLISRSKPSSSRDARLDGIQSQLDLGLSSNRSASDRKGDVQPTESPVRDCSSLPPDTPSGVHTLRSGLRQPVPAFCDQDTDGGGWTVFQRRADIQPRQDFFLDWEAYKWGFGTLEAELWWGLEHLYQALLPDRRYELRVDLEKFSGEKRFAVYQNFRITSEADGYRLNIGNYSGDAGDSLSYHSGVRFSAKDRDQDNNSGNCALTNRAGWWYKNCQTVHLNGFYHTDQSPFHPDGVTWRAFANYYSLKVTEMKFRPSL